MRGRDDAHIHINARRAAEPFDSAFFVDTQQFDLHIRRQVTNLVKEDGRVVREFEPPDPPCDRIGKGAALAAEQLAFHERRGNRRAVHAHHRPTSAYAQLVNLGGKQLFAGAGGAKQQHGRVGRCNVPDLVQDSWDRGTPADDGGGPDFDRRRLVETAQNDAFLAEVVSDVPYLGRVQRSTDFFGLRHRCALSSATRPGLCHP